MKFRLWIHNQGIGEWNSINVNMQPFPKAKTKFIQLLYSQSKQSEVRYVTYIDDKNVIYE